MSQALLFTMEYYQHMDQQLRLSLLIQERLDPQRCAVVQIDQHPLAHGRMVKTGPDAHLRVGRFSSQHDVEHRLCGLLLFTALGKKISSLVW